MKIRTEPLGEITIARYAHMRPAIDFEPAYQREGGVWTRETRSRLIDSIVNGFDLPKLYFERATSRRTTEQGRTIQYAVLDGKQRLEAVGEFLDNELQLPSDFEYFEDGSVSAANLTFAELQSAYPGLAQRILDFELPIVGVSSDSIDLIEELFQRLNAATALNHAERRNSVSGATRDAANALATHSLLSARSPIKASRYKHRELAAKFLAIEHQIDTRNGRISDIKAATLMDLFLASRGNPPQISAAEMARYQATAAGVLDRMAGLFIDDDPLLRSVGTLVVYYIAFRDSQLIASASRERLQRFEELRRLASRMDEDDPAFTRPGNNRLREYNLFVQSSNDGGALSRRAEILTAYLKGYQNQDELAALDAVGENESPGSDDLEDEN
ncbi:DUF262 domain-containing protein [Phycicoccus sp. Soil802]|uniref:DUF262 domain-containing protein n=1 Tax=Phycicoccus sp. Soil802 TaxID=1736414 RepID=UPI0007035361|nr:DUF262 domain-containing protein [Phycicoccus sp. Soil802]KRF28426.1 hypothetical protein ASG91_08190 [Phycicoccus sp. Soil802]